MKRIADTGWLVALLDRRDRHHHWAAELARSQPRPWLTCEAVVTETAHLIGLPELVLTLIERGDVVLDFDLTTEARSVKTLLSRYADQGMAFWLMLVWCGCPNCIPTVMSSPPIVAIFPSTGATGATMSPASFHPPSDSSPMRSCLPLLALLATPAVCLAARHSTRGCRHQCGWPRLVSRGGRPGTMGCCFRRFRSRRHWRWRSRVRMGLRKNRRWLRCFISVAHEAPIARFVWRALPGELPRVARGAVRGAGSQGGEVRTRGRPRWNSMWPTVCSARRGLLSKNHS